MHYRVSERKVGPGSGAVYSYSHHIQTSSKSPSNVNNRLRVSSVASLIVCSFWQHVG